MSTKTLLFCLLFPLLSTAQFVGETEYFVVQEGDTVSGWHDDLNMKDGKFSQYQREFYKKEIAPKTLEKNGEKPIRIIESEILRGEYLDGQPSGTWNLISIRTHTTSLPRGFGVWLQIEYLDGDTIRKTAINKGITFTQDSSYFAGFEKYDEEKILKWICLDQNCKVWMTTETDTLRVSLIDVSMAIDSGRIWEYYEGEKRVFD